PHGVDIPAAFHSWNLMYSEKKGPARVSYYQSTALTRMSAFATACVGCGACEKRCPQSIPIRVKLKEADRALRPFWIRPFLPIGRKIFLRGS
ncbi:MAG: 4Fe-4S dicluster domain-containing protein, partial [Clostridia bacterium]|nr:4Fe-4S dicluster domain-containing protein [Clostridia bacterium]